MNTLQTNLYFRRKLKKQYEKSLKRKRIKRVKRILEIEVPNNPNTNKLQENLNNGKTKEVRASTLFSIINNPNGTLQVFNNLQRLVLNNKPIFFNMSDVNELSIDAILYYLVFFRRLKYKNIDYYIKGDMPNNLDCANLIRSSGFFDYISRGNSKFFKVDDNVMKITIGKNVENSVIRNFCKFVQNKFNMGGNKKVTFQLYDIIAELMNNTTHHAYDIDGNDSEVGINEWYLFAKYIKKSESVKFTFLDRGYGIPKTVSKKFYETINFLQKSDDSNLLLSTLKGDFDRTRTKLKYRGKGVPKIYNYYKKGYIDNFNVVSQKGLVQGDRVQSLANSMEGTLYTWEIHKENRLWKS